MQKKIQSQHPMNKRTEWKQKKWRRSDVNESSQIVKKTTKKAEKCLSYAKKLLKESNALNLEKDIKLKHLLKQNDGIGACSNGKLFVKHSQYFEPEELKTIRSSMPGLKSDSNFILNIIRSLYKGKELEKLKKPNSHRPQVQRNRKAGNIVWKERNHQRFVHRTLECWNGRQCGWNMYAFKKN